VADDGVLAFPACEEALEVHALDATEAPLG